MTTLISNDGSVLRINAVRNQHAQVVFQVELVDGGWPSTAELLTMCDNRSKPDDKHSWHYGGNVEINGKNAVVTVYTD